MYGDSVFTDYIYITDLEPNFNIEVWDVPNICKILNIDFEQLNYLTQRAGKAALRVGYKKAFNVNFFYENNQLVTITSIGMFLLISLNCELKKYPNLKDHLSYFKNLAIHNLIRYHGYKQ